MKKGTIIGLVIFIILSGGIFLLLTNFHFEMFSGREHSYDHYYQKEKWEEKSVSLVNVFNPSTGDDKKPDTKDDVYARLNVNGYALAFGIVFFIPLLLTWPFARRYNRRAERKAEASKTNKI
jgi:hypothetical protein